jgi:hypothetical protein
LRFDLDQFAHDPEADLEAIVIGPANAPQSTMAQAARRKLEFMAAKKKI